MSFDHVEGSVLSCVGGSDPDLGEGRFIDGNGIALAKLGEEVVFFGPKELLGELDPKGALDFKKRTVVRLGLLREPHEIELPCGTNDTGEHLADLADLEAGHAYGLRDLRIGAARIAGGADHTEVASEVDGHGRFGLRVDGELANELSPSRGGGGFLGFLEGALGGGFGGEDQKRQASSFGVFEVTAVGVVVGAHVGFGELTWGGDRLADLAKEDIAQDHAELLFGDGVFVVALFDGFVGEELDIDHFVEELFSALRGLVTKAAEGVHVLEGGGEVSEGDGFVADLGEDLRGLFCGEVGRGRTAGFTGGGFVSAAAACQGGEEDEERRTHEGAVYYGALPGGEVCSKHRDREGAVRSG
jgi:hypothetical protein